MSKLDAAGTPGLVHTKLTGPTQSGASADSIVAPIASNVAAGTTGQPVFVVVAVGDGLADEDCVTYVAQAVDRLTAAANGRTYHWLRPTDVALTWRRWKGV